MHPSTSVLLYHEPMSAVLTRVAYRLIQLHYVRNAHLYGTPSGGMLWLSHELSAGGFGALAAHVSAYAYHRHLGTSTAAYKQLVVRRARWAQLNKEGGKPWARVPDR